MYAQLDRLCDQEQHVCRNVSRHYQLYPLLEPSNPASFDASHVAQETHHMDQKNNQRQEPEAAVTEKTPEAGVAARAG